MPYLNGYTYYKLDKKDELFKHFKGESVISLYITTNIKNTDIKMWAIFEGKIMQENELIAEQKEPNLLVSSNFTGIKNNKVVDYSLEILLPTFRLYKVGSLDISGIENLKESFVNDILAWSSKLSILKEYDEKDIIKLCYCLCVFIDE